MAVSFLLAALLAVNSRYINAPLTPLRSFPATSLRHTPKYLIAASPTYWFDGIETQLAVQSGVVDLSSATAEWVFDDSHIVLVENTTSVKILTRVIDYSGHNKAVTITCWITPEGGTRERIRALMDIIVLGDGTTEIAPSTKVIDTAPTTVLVTPTTITKASTSILNGPTTIVKPERQPTPLNLSSSIITSSVTGSAY